MQSNVVFPSWSQGATGVGPVGQPIQRAQNQSFVSSHDTQDQKGVVSLMGASCTVKRVSLY